MARRTSNALLTTATLIAIAGLGLAAYGVMRRRRSGDTLGELVARCGNIAERLDRQTRARLRAS